MFRLSVCAAFALALIGCGSQQLPTTSNDSAKGISGIRKFSPTQSTLLWQIGDPWKHGVDGDCGTITFPSKTSAQFNFSQGGSPSGGYCMRDQLSPQTRSGTIFALSENTPYTFKFQFKYDQTSGILWQTHVMNGGQNGCGNAPGGPGLAIGDGRYAGKLDFWNLGKNEYVGSYRPGATITIKIEDYLTQTGRNGYAKLYENGALLYTYRGPNLEPAPCAAKPFWNFGPYIPTWQHGKGSGQSARLNVDYMELYTS